MRRSTSQALTFHTDASIKLHDRDRLVAIGGIGMVGDHEVVRFSSMIDRRIRRLVSLDINEAETLAIYEALIWAYRLGYKKVNIKTDSFTAAHILRRDCKYVKKLETSYLRNTVLAFIERRNIEVIIDKIPRAENRIADQLTKSKHPCLTIIPNDELLAFAEISKLTDFIQNKVGIPMVKTNAPESYGNYFDKFSTFPHKGVIYLSNRSRADEILFSAGLIACLRPAARKKMTINDFEYILAQSHHNILRQAREKITDLCRSNDIQINYMASSLMLEDIVMGPSDRTTNDIETHQPTNIMAY